MLQLGQMNRLRVVEITADGYYLEEHDKNTSVWSEAKVQKLLLPRHEQLNIVNLVKQNDANRKADNSTKSSANTQVEIGDELNVFVYLSTNEDIVVTTQTPTAQVGECAYLEVLSVNDHGAFLDWGLPKDLLLPFSEQAYPVREGNSYVVYVYIDERSERVACSTMLHLHLSETSNQFRHRQQVDLLIASKSDLGYKAVVNGEYLGLIFHQELSQPLQFGDRMKGWVKEPRDDGKIDLSIHSLDSHSRNDLADQILAHIKQSGGRAALSDKSSPEEIYRIFKVSKKNFKRALSGLYKQRAIRIEADFIELS